jgi:hypothetical protein
MIVLKLTSGHELSFLIKRLQNARSIGRWIMPDNFTPNVADLGIRATSVLRKELTAFTALRSTPRAISANPQVGDFAGRLQAELNQSISRIGDMILELFDSTLIQLLNLAPVTGVILASVPNNISAGQSGTGTFVLSNLATNPITGLALIASEMTTLEDGSGGPTIASANVTFNPNPVSISPRSSTTVTVQVAVPSGQSAANYYGSILDSANGQVKGLLSIAVN